MRHHIMHFKLILLVFDFELANVPCKFSPDPEGHTLLRAACPTTAAYQPPRAAVVPKRPRHKRALHGMPFQSNKAIC